MRSCRPCWPCTSAKDFDDAVEKAERLIADGGYGHTSSLYINAVTEQEKIAKFAEAMKTCRILINTPSSQGGIGDLYNFKLAPSLTLGCGSWGGNSVSRERGRQASDQHQDRGREEREYAVVPSARKGLLSRRAACRSPWMS